MEEAGLIEAHVAPTEPCAGEEDFTVAVERFLAGTEESGPLYSCKAVGFDAKEALRRVTHADAEFKSDEQKAAMEAVAERRGDLAVILATGCGKTAVVMGPCLYEEGVSVWVSPLRALSREMMSRLRDAGLQVSRADEFEVDGGGVGQVLLVSPEQIGLPQFCGIMRSLEQRTQLNVDEAHIAVMSQGYRECMVQVKTASGMGTLCPVVLLTATAPPGMLGRIAEACGSGVRGLEVIRGDPCRRNRAIRVRNLQDGRLKTLSDEVGKVVKTVVDRTRNEGGSRKGCRYLVVCFTIADAEEIGSQVREKWLQGVLREYGELLVYYSKSCDEAVGQREAGRRDGDGFWTGMDAPDVLTVVFAEGARSLIEFWQGAGRGGRDGNAAEVCVLYHWSHLTRSNGGEGILSPIPHSRDLTAWVERSEVCRRVGIEDFLGGGQGEPTCMERRGGDASLVLCEFCEEGGSGRWKKQWWGRRASKGGAVRNAGPVTLGTGSKVGGFQVAFAGRKRPSTGALEKEHERRTKRLRIEKNGIKWLRRIGRALKDICVGCVVDLSERAEYKTDGSKWGPRFADMARTCGGKCWRRKGQCMRCMQRGHYVSRCDVIESVSKSGRRCCRRCFLISVGGESVHEGAEFGKERGCVIENCVKLLMLCWSKPSVRGELLCEGSPMVKDGGVAIGSAREFAEWLTMDNGEQPAGILSAMPWVHERLDLKHFGM